MVQFARNTRYVGTRYSYRPTRQYSDVGSGITTVGKYTIVRHTADSTNRARFPPCVPCCYLKWRDGSLTLISTRRNFHVVTQEEDENVVMRKRKEDCNILTPRNYYFLIICAHFSQTNPKEERVSFVKKFQQIYYFIFFFVKNGSFLT